MHLYGLICVCVCILVRVSVWFAYSHAGFDLVQPAVSELPFIFPPVYMGVCMSLCGCVCVFVLVSILTCSICPCALKHSSTRHNFSQVCVCGCVYMHVCVSMSLWMCLCVFVCVYSSQQGTCRCSLFNLAGLGEKQVTSQTLFSQHTAGSYRYTQTT